MRSPLQMALHAIECHKSGQPCTMAELRAAGVTAEQVRAAVRSGLVRWVVPNQSITANKVDHELYAKADRATALPVPVPSFDRARGLYTWPDPDEAGQLRHFGVQLCGLIDGKPSGRVVRVDRTTGASHKDNPGFWRQDHLYQGPDELQLALRHAHRANELAAEGAFVSSPPWRHPAEDEPDFAGHAPKS